MNFKKSPIGHFASALGNFDMIISGVFTSELIPIIWHVKHRQNEGKEKYNICVN